MSTLVARLRPIFIPWHTLVLIVIAGTAAWLGWPWVRVALAPRTPDAVMLINFYPPEGGSSPYQFSRATSSMLLPSPPRTASALTLRVRSPIPLETRQLAIAYNQQPIATLALRDQARVVSILLPRSPAETSGMLFAFTTNSVPVAGDKRHLGFAFNDVTVNALAHASSRNALVLWGAALLVLVGGASSMYLSTRRLHTRRLPSVQRLLAIRMDAPALAAFSACSLYAVFFSWFTMYKYQLFRTNAYDLGVYDQTLWLISRGYSPYNTTMGVHILGNHGSLLVYPLSLLYLLVPDVRALLALQSVALALGGWMLYQIGRGRNYPVAGVLVACAYLLHAAVQHLNMADFHPDALAATALIGAFWCADRQRWALMFVACAMVLVAKENFALTIVAFGMWLLLQRQPRRGLVIIAVSLVWFFVVTKGIEPYYNGLDRPVHLDRYSLYGDSMGAILATFVTKPQMLLHQVFASSKLWYIIYLTLPFGMACWLSPRTLVVALPALALNLITDYEPQTAMQGQYDALIVAVLAVAALEGLWYLKSAVSYTQAIVPLTACVAMAGTLFVHAAVPSTTADHLYTAYADTSGRQFLYDYALSRIPADAGLMAQSRIQPHLAHRQQAFLLPKPFTSEGMTNVAGMPFIPDIQYIVYDSDMRYSPYMSDDDVKRIFADAQRSQPYTKVLDLDGITLLKRTAP